MDATTLLASIATVVALFYLIHDRRDQANIAAWTLLQAYLQQEHRTEYNQGQVFAFETLAQHGVDLNDIDAHDVKITVANLHGLIAQAASFKNAYLGQVDLSNADFTWTDFSSANIYLCDCRGIILTSANLKGAKLEYGDFRGASFRGADISDLDLSPQKIDRDALKEACYQPGHPPKLFRSQLDLPVLPQRMFCFLAWREAWGITHLP